MFYKNWREILKAKRFKSEDGPTDVRPSLRVQNYAAVLFVSEDGKVLLSPRDEQFCLPARMTKEESLTVQGLFLNIFCLDYRKSGRNNEPYEAPSADGCFLERYRYHWVLVKHASSDFVKQSVWCPVEQLSELELSPLAQIAIAQATADGVVSQPLAEAA